MKWTEDKEIELIELKKQGKTNDEISLIFNTTKKSIESKCFILGLKTNYSKIKIYCKNCGKEILGNRRNIFCNKSCSVTYNNKKRVLSDDTKNKIRTKILKNNVNKEKVEKIKQKVKIKCKICGNDIIEKNKRICEFCKLDYYKFYRPECEFDFNLSDYPDKFDFNLIEKYGWYSPTNKKNNLNGVSRDHMYSVKDGFINKINPKIIKHPANCKLMIHTNNSSKHSKSSITIGELLERIEKW